jgi:hypothetical protein
MTADSLLKKPTRLLWVVLPGMFSGKLLGCKRFRSLGGFGDVGLKEIMPSV